MTKKTDSIDVDSSVVPRKVIEVSGNNFMETTEIIVEEKAITIYVFAKELTTIVCSPWDEIQLAIGFLHSEGILKNPEDLQKITLDKEKGLVYAEVKGFFENEPEKLFLKRHITPSGGRSKSSYFYSADALLYHEIKTNLCISKESVKHLANLLQNNSRLFQKTGGVHSAALAKDEELVIFYEDIGRHNTLDKILGRCFMEGISTHDKILLFSGRVSSEILLKTAKIGVPVIISRSAPTDLALQLAEDLGITVIGFARGERFNIYTHPERISLK